MILIVGLGNPGKKFQKTRHNIGFRVVDEIAANFQFGALFGSSNFQSIFNAKISKGEIDGQKIILAKPQTFMNLSGKAVKKLTDNLQLTTDNLWVVHDDMDLTLGKIKIVKNRGSAGHKGVQSVINELRTKNFVRFRVGIRPKSGKPKDPEKFVLKKFLKGEEKIIKNIIKTTTEAIEIAIVQGLQITMTKFNK